MKDASPQKKVRSECGYLLCASPRSGSTLLCDLLIRSGTAGSPESFFRPQSVSDYAKKWGLTLDDLGWGEAYVQAVRRYAEAGTGCVGVRTMWSNVPEFSARLDQLYPGSESDRARILDALGIDRYIHLSRGDKVAQAVSLVIAKQTGLWHLNSDGSERQRDKPPEQPVYSREQITEELQILEAEALGWDSWFETNKIEPLRITYEELAADPIGTFSKVMRFIGCEAPEQLSVGTEKMATKLNQAWSDRFRAG